MSIVDINSLYFHYLNTLQAVGPVRLLRLYRFFGAASSIREASFEELTKAGIDLETASFLKKNSGNIPYENLEKNLTEQNIKLLSIEDPLYPTLLKEISQPPVLLYYKGVLGASDELCIAVVGTRKISSYGRTVIPMLLEPVIATGTVIVSGLAFGADSQAHKLCVDAGTRTIAVVGNGLDDKSFYPKDHALLAEEILNAGGMILSEYPPGTTPLKHHFLARNRIISGLCSATIIIECNLKSGSLITAKYALEQNRTVFAVPGPIYAETSQGPHNLIKMGAKILTTSEDILEDLNIKTLPVQKEIQTTLLNSPLEQTILNLLSFDPLAINAIIKQSGLTPAQVSSAMIFLEMKGKVRNVGAQQYIRAR